MLMEGLLAELGESAEEEEDGFELLSGHSGEDVLRATRNHKVIKVKAVAITRTCTDFIVNEAFEHMHAFD